MGSYKRAMNDSAEANPRRRGRPTKASVLNNPTRQRIIEAATDVLVERGTAGLTLREVARRAELTAPAIYTHFDGLSELLLAVVLRQLQTHQMDFGTDAAQQLADWITALDPTGRRILVDVYAAAAREPELAGLLHRIQSESADRFRPALNLDAAEFTALSMILLGASFMDSLDGLGADRNAVAKVIGRLVGELITPTD